MAKGKKAATKDGAEQEPQAQEAVQENAAKVEKEQRQALPRQNGVTRPKEGTSTGRVWEIADTLSADQGEPAKRSDVLSAFTSEGGNPSTGATQYGRWRKFHGLGREAAAATPDAGRDVAEDAVTVEEDSGEE